MHPSRSVKSRSHFGLLAAAVVLLCGCSRSLGTNAPDLVVAPEPAPQASSITVPISVSMASLQTLVDNAFPRSFGAARYNLSDCNADGCGPDRPACLWHAGYEMTRTPVALSGDKQSFIATTQMSYWLAARVRIPFCTGLVRVGCGDEHNAGDRRHMNVALTASVKLKDDWDTEVSQAQANVTPMDECRVGPFGVKNITDKLTEAVRNRLNGMTSELDGTVRDAAKLQERVANAWNLATQPIEVSKGVWLAVNPDQLQASQPAVVGSNLETRVGLVARPAVVVGNRPPAPVRPVPARTDPDRADVFEVNVPVDIPFGTIQAQLRRALSIDAGGVRVPPSGKYYLRPIDVTVQGYGRQVVVGLPVTGKVPGFLWSKRLKGTVYLQGTPSYDPATGIVSFPDLDYTAETNSVLLKIADFFKHEDWRSQLRGQMKVNIRSEMQAARTNLLKALNTDHGGAKLKGHVDDLGLLGLWSDPGRQSVRALGRGTGTVSLEIVP
jgi:hypothetical protein